MNYSDDGGMRLRMSIVGGLMVSILCVAPRDGFTEYE